MIKKMKEKYKEFVKNKKGVVKDKEKKVLPIKKVALIALLCMGALTSCATVQTDMNYEKAPESKIEENLKMPEPPTQVSQPRLNRIKSNVKESVESIKYATMYKIAGELVKQILSKNFYLDDPGVVLSSLMSALDKTNIIKPAFQKEFQDIVMDALETKDLTRLNNYLVVVGEKIQSEYKNIEGNYQFLNVDLQYDVEDTEIIMAFVDDFCTNFLDFTENAGGTEHDTKKVENFKDETQKPFTHESKGMVVYHINVNEFMIEEDVSCIPLNDSVQVVENFQVPDSKNLSREAVMGRYKNNMFNRNGNKFNPELLQER